MSRLSRTELKGIVKECLVEILSEGLAPSVKSSKKLQENFKRNSGTSNSARRRNLSNIGPGKQSSRASTGGRKTSYLDNISFGQDSNEEKNTPNINTSVTSDPILNELLADTAMSTLQEQASAERGHRTNVSTSKPADQAAMIASQNAPEDLFGDEAAGKWATLAFS